MTGRSIASKWRESDIYKVISQALPNIPDKTIEIDMLRGYNCYYCDIKGMI